MCPPLSSVKPPVTGKCVLFAIVVKIVDLWRSNEIWPFVQSRGILINVLFKIVFFFFFGFVHWSV